MKKESIYTFNSDVKYLDERLPFNIKNAPTRDWDEIYNWWIKYIRANKRRGINYG